MRFIFGLMVFLIAGFFATANATVKVNFVHAQVNEYHFITLSDIHLGSKQIMEVAPTGRNPDNDLDLATFEKFLNNINGLIVSGKVQPESGLILGDSVNHINGSMLTGSPEGRAIQLQDAFKNLLQAFQKSKLPLFYTFGNEDSLYGNYQQFYDKDFGGHSTFLIAKKAGWKAGFMSADTDCKKNNSDQQLYPCLNTDAEDQNNGYYSGYLKQNLKLIVLNTSMFDASNFNTYHGNNYNGELDWLKQELAVARQKNDSVLIAMHIPPGINFYDKAPFWQKKAFDDFMDVIKTNSDHVIGILAGHTHNEELRFIRISNQRIIPIILTAGLSTSHGNAPSFKYFTVTRNAKNGKWTLKNYETYYYAKNQFDALYDFNSAYCPDLQNTAISQCLQKFVVQNNLSKLLDTMNKYFTAGNPNNHAIAHDTHVDDLETDLMH